MKAWIYFKISFSCKVQLFLGGIVLEINNTSSRFIKKSERSDNLNAVSSLQNCVWYDDTKWTWKKITHNLRLINIDDDTNEKPVQRNQSQTLNGK